MDVEENSDDEEHRSESPAETGLEKQGSQKTREEDKRPRKRRKLSVAQDDIPETPQSVGLRRTEAGDEEVASPQTESNTRRRSPTPPATLPLFPLPTRPDAPSKSALALQGLDKALVEAQIIDPTRFQSFPSTTDSDGGTGLGEKTRKRLNELGINELFAGLSPRLSFP